MLVVETIARIRREHLVRGVPIKKIARDLRVSKNTVRKALHEAARVPPADYRDNLTMPPKGSLLDADRGSIFNSSDRHGRSSFSFSAIQLFFVPIQFDKQGRFLLCPIAW